MGRSTVIAIVLALLATGWILSGILVEPEANNDVQAIAPAAGDSADEAVPVPVRVMWSEARTRPGLLVVNGRTEASRSVTLRAETAGRVESIAAERGARLEPGQEILRIALDMREAERAEAQALVEQRELEHTAASTLKERGHSAATQVAAAHANLEAARALLARIEQDIGDTRIAAPFAGVLDERPVELGDYVKDGDTVATLVDLDPLLVVADVSEVERTRLEVGQPASARLISGREVEGRIRFISAKADPDTRTFEVEVEVPNPDGAIVDGLTAQLRIPHEGTRAHRVSPSALTLDDEGRLGVRVADGSDAARFMPVRLVGSEGDSVWIAGLPDRVRLIVVGQEFVRDGAPIDPVEVEAPPAGAAVASGAGAS